MSSQSRAWRPGDYSAITSVTAALVDDSAPKSGRVQDSAQILAREEQPNENWR